MKYTYPMIASFTRNTYLVRENKHDPARLDFIHVIDDSKFISDRTKESFESLIASGDVTINTVVEAAPANTEFLKITELDKALATAKELEATMLRIKGVFA